MDVDEIADRLYSLPPEEFTAARNDAARAVEDPAVRMAVKALRRPTAAAHAVNRLARERPDDVDALVSLGDRMRQATTKDPGLLRNLSEERRALIASMLDPALPAGVQQDVTATLEAATADPNLGAAVRSGRLVKPLSYAGFGALPDLDDALATPLRLVGRKQPSRRPKPAPKEQSDKQRKKPPTKQTPTTSTARTASSDPRRQQEEQRAAARHEQDLAAARQRVLELAGVADDAQRRYEQAARAAVEARELLERAEAERTEAHRTAREAHSVAERARRDLGRLERS